MKFIVAVCIVFALEFSSILSNSIPQTNFLFIMFDDLRTELSIYDRKHMITPNFERLAARSVIFDQAYAQVAVCNPSRDSLLTGLRPDTTGTYGFQSSFRPHLILPTHLARSGYNTAGYGKIAHWDGPDPEVWNFDSWENGWYEYQNKEREFMNSSTMPDKIKPEEDFRDYQFTTRAIEALHKLHKLPQYFMLALGFKLPHLAVHLPHKYFEMYKDKTEYWTLSKKESRFPPSTPAIGYRCCAEMDFRFMNNEGAEPAVKSIPLPDINMVYTDRMRDELMMGYCGAVTFVDKQLGRLLDVVDSLQLWSNLTIVLTADHGMHNGEKGIWEKWSMFDESTRVPLLIHHPLSPFQGQHYKQPVELIDVYKTVKDLLAFPDNHTVVCTNSAVCHKLQGKSLAPVVLGSDLWGGIKQSKQKQLRYGTTSPATATTGKNSLSLNMLSTTNSRRRNLRSPLFSQLLGGSSNGSTRLDAGKLGMPKLRLNFAISQNWRCAKKQQVKDEADALAVSPDTATTTASQKYTRKAFWVDCDKTTNSPDEVSLMGYSMRTLDYRYTAWFHFNKAQAVPMLDSAPYAEELYDHKGETLADYTHMETVNVVQRPGYAIIAQDLRTQLVTFIRKNMLFRGPFKD